MYVDQFMKMNGTSSYYTTGREIPSSRSHYDFPQIDTEYFSDSTISERAKNSINENTPIRFNPEIDNNWMLPEPKY